MAEKTTGHKETCECTYCVPDPAASNMLNCPELTDGLGQTKPEVYQFAKQSADEVAKLLEAARKIKAGRDAYRPSRTPGAKLLGGFIDETQPVLKRGPVDCPVTQETRATWQKLSGVKPDQKVFANEVVNLLVETINGQLACKLADLPISWSDECTFQYLKIGETATNIQMERILAAYNALLGITDEGSAADIVATTVVGKLEKLFV